MRLRFLHTEGFRLSAIYAGVFALSMLLLGGFILIVNDQAFRAQIGQSARSDIAAIRNAYDTQGVGEAREIVRQMMAASDSSDYLLLQKDGRKLEGNMPVMAPRFGTVQIKLGGPRRPHRVLGEGLQLAPGLYVFSGSDLRRAHSVHEQILHTLEWLFLIALGIAVIGGALVSRTFLRRMDAMAVTCQAIMQGDLKARIPRRGAQDELDRLADTINQMLGRIDALMENLHQVVNDIAHDLRTPLTHLRHRLEQARTESRSVDDHRLALDQAICASDDILALFAALLRIAEIEGGARRAGFGRVDVAVLLNHLNEVFAPVAEDAGHQLRTSAAGDCFVSGDRDLLTQLFSNLIENAIVHTPSGTCIALRAEGGKDGVTVTVRDDGPGVPQAEHDKLFRPLYRREASRTRPGHGLGLSLVAAIAELHGAALRLETDTPGFAITIFFPA